MSNNDRPKTPDDLSHLREILSKPPKKTRHKAVLSWIQDLNVLRAVVHAASALCSLEK